MRKLSVPEWCCAVRFNDSSDVSLLDNNEKEFIVLKDSCRYWTADPFLAEQNGRYYLFFEAYDRLKRKGVLGCRELFEKGAGKIKIIYECSSHVFALDLIYICYNFGRKEVLVLNSWITLEKVGLTIVA